MYSFNSRVRYSESNEEGILSYASMIDYLQDCCTFQSEDLGVGLPYLRENKLGWFITSWDIKIRRLPAMGEKIKVSTWPYGFRGFLGNRNFTICDEAGEILVEADSLWILMDLEKQMPKRLPEEMQQAFALDPPLESNRKTGKLRPETEAEAVRDFVVDQTYVDSNHHMNNGYYVEAAAGELPKGSSLTEILVEYKKPAVLGDHIYCYRGEQGKVWQIVLGDEAKDPYAILEFRGE